MLVSVSPGIRQLQLILLKVALLLGVEVHTGVEFRGLQEPSGNTGTRSAFRTLSVPLLIALVGPLSPHSVNSPTEQRCSTKRSRAAAVCVPV